MYGRSALLRGWVALVYVFLLLPLAVIVAVSVNPSSAFRIPTDVVSLRWYAKFFASPAFRDSLFLVSLPVALCATVVATLVGALAAVAIVRFRIAGREVLEAFFMLPLLIPSILLGAALYLVYARIGVAGTFWSLVVGHALLGTPYVVRVVGAGLAGIDPALEDAAVSLGCSRVQAFVRVVLPLLRSSLLSGGIFAFIVSFSDINLALFVAGPSTTTLPIHIFSQIFWEGDPTLAAASALQILLVGSLILVIQRVFRVRIAF